MNNTALTIFSVYHKDFAIPDCDFIKPIQVGRIFSNLNLGFNSDDQGESIAEKNKTFSELTALFWIWKNLSKIDSQWIGLCHYRRYFILPEKRIKKKLLGNKAIIDPRDIYYKPFDQSLLNDVSALQLKEELITSLSLGKVIVPSPAQLTLDLKVEANIKMHYIYYHIREDWYLMRSAVILLHPEYEQSFDNFFEQETEMYCYNMFIASKEVFDAYCAWLFPILFELEKTVKLSEYEYQRRIFGFFSERLFNLYILHNQLDTAAFPVLFFT